MVEVLVPLGQPRVEHAGFGDLPGLPVVGRGQRRACAQADDQAGAILAKLLGQGHTRLKGVEQPAIGQVECHSDLHAQHLGRRAGFGQADFRAGRGRRRLAVGQIDNPHAVALLGQFGQRATTGNFHVVGMHPTAITSNFSSSMRTR